MVSNSRFKIKDSMIRIQKSESKTQEQGLSRVKRNSARRHIQKT